LITDAQFAAWLGDSSAQRVTLFEVGAKSAGVDVTRYLSTDAFIGSAATPYLAVVAGGLQVTESISMTTEASLSAGDIELYNADGSLDAWLDDVWANQPVSVFVGDARWGRADFRQVFAGTVIDIDCKSRDRLNLRLTNKLERLNTPVTDVKIGGSATNPDTLVPVLLGECHNIAPPQTNPNTNEYAFGGNERLIEVRLDGVPRDVTANLPAGRFTFNAAVGAGQVTCSAQGVRYNGAYANTISQLVQCLVTQYGKATTRFAAADLDAAQLAAFDAANPQPVGLYLTERTNVLAACQQLASSIGAQLVMSMTGKLRLIQFAIPTSATTEIRPSQQSGEGDGRIKIVNRTEVPAAVKIGYCRNWTEQDNLQSSLPPAHKAMYGQPWLSVTSVDAVVQATYKRDAEPDLVETCLLRKTDAQAEADRRRDIVKVPRTTYRFETTPDQLLVELGQAVKLFSNRFGLAAGKVGIVTSRTVDWATLRSTLEVTV